MYPHAWNLVFRTFFRYVPIPVLLWLRYLPSREYIRFRQFQDFMRKYARTTILPNSQAKDNSKDMISVILRANQAEDLRLRLADFEVDGNISYFFVCGSFLSC